MSSAPTPWPGSDRAYDSGEEDEWDFLVIGGNSVPGVVEIRGEIGRRVETRQAPGTDGAHQTFINYRLAELDVRVRMWTAAHFNQWLEICAAIQPTPGSRTRKPFEVVHPALSAQGITKATVLTMAIPTRGNGRDIDVWTSTIKLREWRKPLQGNSVKTPTSAQQEPTLTTDFKTAADADTEAPSKTQTGP